MFITDYGKNSIDKLEKGNIGFIIDKFYVLCFFIFGFSF
jgi:hypothetical protein